MPSDESLDAVLLHRKVLFHLHIRKHRQIQVSLFSSTIFSSSSSSLISSPLSAFCSRYPALATNGSKGEGSRAQAGLREVCTAMQPLEGLQPSASCTLDMPASRCVLSTATPETKQYPISLAASKPRFHVSCPQWFPRPN